MKDKLKHRQELVCVVIPVYKNFSGLSDYELISIENCFKKLGAYRIIFTGSDKLDWEGYNRYCNEKGFSFEVIRFAPVFFSGIEGYNRLLLSVDFYRAFNAFKYILIHQTDCYIFRDELADWCAMNYDYIGAPFFADVKSWIFSSGLYPEGLKLYYRYMRPVGNRVGNGGLSLRKVSACESNLRLFNFWAENWKANEDSFFSHCAGAINPFFKIPDWKKALAFSFDAEPMRAYTENDGRLPFGCHGWYRTDAPHYTDNLQFWQQYIL